MIVIVLCPIIVTICLNTLQGAITWTKTRHYHLSVEDPVKHSLLKLPNWLKCTEILGFTSGMTFFFLHIFASLTCLTLFKHWIKRPGGAGPFQIDGWPASLQSKFLQLVTLRCFLLQILTFHLPHLGQVCSFPLVHLGLQVGHFRIPFHFKAMDKNPGPNETSPRFLLVPQITGCNKNDETRPASCWIEVASVVRVYDFTWKLAIFFKRALNLMTPSQC